VEVVVVAAIEGLAHLHFQGGLGPSDGHVRGRVQRPMLYGPRPLLRTLPPIHERLGRRRLVHLHGPRRLRLRGRQHGPDATVRHAEGDPHAWPDVSRLIARMDHINGQVQAMVASIAVHPQRIAEWRGAIAVTLGGFRDQLPNTDAGVRRVL